MESAIRRERKRKKHEYMCNKEIVKVIRLYDKSVKNRI